MLKSINIDSEIHKKLKVFCAERGITITEFIHQGIREALGKIPLNGEEPFNIPKTKIPEKPINDSEKYCIHLKKYKECKLH